MLPEATHFMQNIFHCANFKCDTVDGHKMGSYGWTSPCPKPNFCKKKKKQTTTNKKPTPIPPFKIVFIKFD